MLNRKEFFEYVKDNVKDYLPPSFDTAEISIRQVTKNNDMKLNSIVIQKEGEHVIPTIYVDPLYQAYRRGKSLDACVASVADMRIEHDGVELNFQIEDLRNYEAVKDKLQVRLCDTEKNEERLQGKVTTQHGDFTAYYAVIVGETEEGTGMIAITEQMREDWGISTEQLHSDALAADKTRMPMLMSMDDMMNQMMFGRDEAENLLTSEKTVEDFYQPFFCLTNAEKQNGASLILQDDLMKQIGEFMNSDFYLLPSSIHETLILADNGAVKLPELTAMVREVNATQVAPEEQLSDKVQYYDRTAGVLENAEKREMRLAREKDEKLDRQAGQKTAKKGLHSRLAEAKAEVKSQALAKGNVKSNVKSQETSL